MAHDEARFCAVVGTKDEGDILPLVIGQLRSIGVGRILVFDHASTDGSLAYLAEAERAGDLWVIHVAPEVDTDVLARARVALAHASEAEWILFLDADEIPLPRSGSLHELHELETVDVLSVPRYNVVIGPDGPMMGADTAPSAYQDVLLYAQPIPDFYRHSLREPDTPWIAGVLEPKVLVRPSVLASLEAGAHDVEARGGSAPRRAIAQDILIAHLPLRSEAQFRRRSANYQAAVARDPAWFTGYQGWQWVRFARMADEGRTDEEFRRQTLTADALSELRRRLIVRSAREIFDELVPRIGDESAYLEMASRAEPWLSMTGLVCRREGLDPGGKLEHLSGHGQFPVVLVPPDRIVKFYGPWRRGHEFCDREIQALEVLAAANDVPVPRLIVQGWLDDTYRYLVMSRVLGSPLSDQEVSETSRRALGGWLGSVLQRLHAAPIDESRRGQGRAWYEEVAGWRRREARRFAEARRMPPALQEQIDGWLPPVHELGGPSSEAVLCHGDLNDTNVMGWTDGQEFVPLGIIDLNQSFVGPPIADLGPIWWHVLRRDREALAAFLETSGLHAGLGAAFPRLALAWALLTPSWGDEPELDGIREVGTLDELAELWFGGHSRAAMEDAGGSSSGGRSSSPARQAGK